MAVIYHFTNKSNINAILKDGLKATSRYEQFTELRRNVVYCWISPDDQKIFNDDDICLEINVEDERCIVASMDYISFAMMYKYGGKKYGGKNIPINLKASELFANLYSITSVALSQYDDNFFSPEVLVKGDISPNCIRVYNK